MMQTMKRAPTADTAGAQTNETSGASFKAIVHHLAEIAKIKGDNAERIDRAVAIIEADAPNRPTWAWAMDRRAMWVSSQNGSASYRVDGSCPCPDHKYRGLRCKHLIARDLIAAAEAIVGEVDHGA